MFPDISLYTKLIELGIDSITHIRLVVNLEEEFNFAFDDEIVK